MERLKNLLISNKAQARMRDTDDEEESDEEFGSSWVELDSGNASDGSESGGSLQSSSVLSSPTLSSNASASPMMISNNNHNNNNNNNNANNAMMNYNIASSPLIGSSSNAPASSSSGTGSSYGSFFSSMIGGGSSSFSFGIGSPKLDFLRSKRQRKKIRGKSSVNGSVESSDSECSSPSLGFSPFSSPLLSFRSHHNNTKDQSLPDFRLFSELPVELQVSPLQYMCIPELSKAALVCRDWASMVQQSHSLWKGRFHKIGVNSSPPVRVCHGSLSYKDSLFVYGGHVPSEHGDFITSVRSDLWEYHIPTHEWKKVCNFEPLTETSPILYNDKMYIFGGFINSWRTSTIIEYDFQTKKYTKTASEDANTQTPALGAPPKGRSAYSSVVYKNCMYIYGGWDGHESMNDIHCYNLDTKQWVPQQQVNNSQQPNNQQQQQPQQPNNDQPQQQPNNQQPQQQQPQQPESIAPCVRSHCAWVWNDSMYVWGGYGQNGHPTDLFRYNFLEEDASKRWTKVETKGAPPCGRSRMKCLVFENRVFIVGGWDRKKLLGDFWELNMETGTWKELKQTGLPKGISQYSVNLYKNVMLTFGGCCDGESSSHVFGFKLFGKQS